MDSIFNFLEIYNSGFISLGIFIIVGFSLILAFMLSQHHGKLIYGLLLEIIIFILSLAIGLNFSMKFGVENDIFLVKMGEMVAILMTLSSIIVFIPFWRKAVRFDEYVVDKGEKVQIRPTFFWGCIVGFTNITFVAWIVALLNYMSIENSHSTGIVLAILVVLCIIWLSFQKILNSIINKLYQRGRENDE